MGSFHKNDDQKDGSVETLRLSLKSAREEARFGWGSREHALSLYDTNSAMYAEPLETPNRPILDDG